MRILPFALVLSLCLVLMSGCGKDREKKDEKPKQEPPKVEGAAPEAKKDQVKAGGDPFKPGVWVDLFDGKSMEGWKSSPFGGEGKPKVENGLLIVTVGQTLSGVTSTRKDLPKMGYEIELDAQKLEGGDFFCGLTFPVGDSHASLVLGGWGGQICGISSLDYQDAANNETTKAIEFKDKEWYHVRMRILPKKLQAWLDHEQIVDANTEDRKVDIRIDISESVPFGLATYQTAAAYKNIRVRRLTEEELNPKD
jgi:hypothetical protein